MTAGDLRGQPPRLDGVPASGQTQALSVDVGTLQAKLAQAQAELRVSESFAVSESASRTRLTQRAVVAEREAEQLRRLAKVGLRALIDEATGFQQVRAPHDLREYADQVGVGDLAAIIDERIALATSVLSAGTDPP